MLEQLCHSETCFVTLTYDEEHKPFGGSLLPRHYQLFMKNLRTTMTRMGAGKVRYFFVGEYGEDKMRPHYHAALFGVPSCYYFKTASYEDKKGRRTCKCPPCTLIRNAWGRGTTDCNVLCEESAQYIVGYVVKKMTSSDDPRRKGLHPEFARMSLKPGIGALAVPFICEPLTTDAGVNTIIKTGDVPVTLRQGRKSLPLGRYLRKKLREKLGFADTATPQEVLLHLQRQQAEVLAAELKKPQNKNKTAARIFVDINKQKVLNLETRQKIFSKKGTL